MGAPASPSAICRSEGRGQEQSPAAEAGGHLALLLGAAAVQNEAPRASAARSSSGAFIAVPARARDVSAPPRPPPPLPALDGRPPRERGVAALLLPRLSEARTLGLCGCALGFRDPGTGPCGRCMQLLPPRTAPLLVPS